MKGSTTTSPRFEIGIEEGAFQILWAEFLQPTRVCGSGSGERSGFWMQMLRFGICGLEGLV